MTKKVIGRPKSKNPRDHMHIFRLNAGEQVKFQGGLDRSGRKKSDYIRDKVLK